MRPITQNLGATALILSAPLLGGYSLGWVIPLLGGLWWGAVGGSWIGALAAGWGMLAAGMGALTPDWLAIFGHIPPMPAVMERFSGADSLETLSLLVSPLIPDSTILLYHLLQIALWGLVGMFAGKLNDRSEIQNRRPWGGALIAIGGGFVLLGAHLALATWLGQSIVTMPNYSAWILAAAASGVIAAALEMLQDFFEHPLPRGEWSNPKPGKGTTPEPESSPNPVPSPVEFLPLKQEIDPDDLILLELDEN
jgi:hypothetical protein